MSTRTIQAKRRAVAVAVFHPTDPRRILLVRRPDHPDEDLPGIWGLPAVTLHPRERPATAVKRIAARKLGLDLNDLHEVAQGSQPNRDGPLSMTVFTARTGSAQPTLPTWRPDATTLYTDWRWDSPQALEEGAAQGSLCCRLYIQATSQRNDTIAIEGQKQRHVILRFHEIALKGANRPWFIERLVNNARQATRGLGVKRVWRGQMMVLLSLDTHADWATIKERLTSVFGVAKFSLVHPTPRSMDAIKEASQRLIEGRSFASFRIAARRADKSFPLTSAEINRDLGRFVQDLTSARVDLTRPDFTLFVDILPREALLYDEEVPGPGGLPVGVSGRILALLSGGIDSPVAAWRMLKRGCPVDFVHFHAFPLVEGVSREKAQELAELLNRYQSSARLLLVPFAEAQKKIILSVPAAYRILVYRRFMLRIAQRLAERHGIQALVTGESLGQVGSQTLENLTTIRQVVSLPILSPLIGMDKQEIIDCARVLGTYPISIIPDQDCCTLFVPKHPRTRSTAAELDAVEATLDIPAIVDETVAATEVRHIGAPERS